jgi:hypothetical protein
VLQELLLRCAALPQPAPLAMAGPVMSRFLGFRHHGFFPAILRSDSYTSAGCCSLWNPMVDRMMALNVQPPSAIMGSSSMAFAFKLLFI